jgi:IS1 family transposase
VKLTKQGENKMKNSKAYKTGRKIGNVIAWIFGAWTTVLFIALLVWLTKLLIQAIF